MKRRIHFSFVLLILLSLLELILIVFVWQDTQQTSIVIEWSTASELDTIGFNVYRSETLGGLAEKLNEQLIPAAADSFVGGTYQYTDATAHPGNAYYYWLEDVDASGAVNRNGPIEARAGAWVFLEWALLFVLMGIIVWGWIGLFNSRTVVVTQMSQTG